MHEHLAPTPYPSGYNLGCYNGYRLLSSNTPAYGSSGPGICTPCLAGTFGMGGLSCNVCTPGYYSPGQAANQAR